MKIFLTGGAPAVSEAQSYLPLAKGHDTILFDNLSTGHNWAVFYGTLKVQHLEDSSYLESGN